MTYTPTITPSVTITPSLTTAPTLTNTPTTEPTPIELYNDHYAFNRPIADTGIDYADRTYAYGDTQRGRRRVHLGIDFANPRGTPVLAAGSGIILYAGSDVETIFGPEPNYYGNVVVIEHGVTSPEGLPVYTLYGHLDRVEVETGQSIDARSRVGIVGDKGVAIGPHLHFEVRVGDPYDYRSTRNPDLWIFPYPTFGTLAGRVVNTAGEMLQGIAVQITSEAITTPRYAFTYGDDSVNSSAAWGENFTYGDLPEGVYTVLVSEDGRRLFEADVPIESGRTAWVDIVLNQ
ncbi:MAG: hypothetical protein OHK0046_04110 [Anaerolineae bacterium]